MPTSQYHQIPKVLDLIIAATPNKLLDIGVGFGKYGFLSREYLEVWGQTEGYGTFKKTIDGIEVFEKYLTPVHRYLYNTIFIGNAKEVVPTLSERYDLVLLIDVLEHLPEDEGGQMLKTLLEKNNAVLISAPRDIGEQAASYGNDHEAHITQWTVSKLKKFGHLFFIEDSESYLCLIANTTAVLDEIKKQYRKNRMVQWLITHPMLFRAARFLKKLVK